MVLLQKNGVTKQRPTGFSFTILLFGGLPALFRGDFLWGFLLIAGLMILGMFTGPFAFLLNLAASLFYNNKSIEMLEGQGWSRV